MITKISTAYVRKNFSSIVNRVSFGKESIILTRRGKEIAALVAMDQLRLLQELEDRIDIPRPLRQLNAVWRHPDRAVPEKIGSLNGIHN